MQWVPAAEFFKGKEHFVSCGKGEAKGADPSDIHQGNVGDCWFLAGLSMVAHLHEDILKLMQVCSEPTCSFMRGGTPAGYVGSAAYFVRVMGMEL